jgi:hypothetical protein
LSGEFDSQQLFSVQATGPIPQSFIYQFGGFTPVGYFLIPQQLEPYRVTAGLIRLLGMGLNVANPML